MPIVALLGLAVTLWWIGSRLSKEAKKQPTWSNDFCVIPPVDLNNGSSFIYEYDLPTQEKRDHQFWAMVDFVNEQALIKQRGY